MSARNLPNQKNRSETALISDADNTLWDTDRIYAETQLWLLSQVEEAIGKRCAEDQRLDFVRRIDQGLAQKHHRGLRYPVVLLANALEAALRGEAVPIAIRTAMGNQVAGQQPLPAKKLGDEFEARIKFHPPLRNGVDSGLERLHHQGVRVVVATEGSADTCKQRLTHWGLERFVTHVISAPKTVELFLRIANLVHLPTHDCFAVGDQLDRDIAPARTAGCRTIYFPGGFNPVWAPKVDQIQPDHVISSFDEVSKIIGQARQAPAAHQL